MLHILVGDAGEDKKTILDSAKSGKSVDWFVPKKAKVGERVLFYLPTLGFAAQGTLRSNPRGDKARRGWYRASVSVLHLIHDAVPLEFVRRNDPEWRWSTYPRSYTSITGKVEERLRQVLEMYKSVPSVVTQARAFPRVLFARIGWMKWYRGPQTNDQKPVGGGKYTTQSLGHEAFNFLPINNKVYGYFQPQLQSKERRKRHPSSIKLEKIEPGFHEDKLTSVLVIFVAKDPADKRSQAGSRMRLSTGTRRDLISGSARSFHFLSSRMLAMPSSFLPLGVCLRFLLVAEASAKQTYAMHLVLMANLRVQLNG